MNLYQNLYLESDSNYNGAERSRSGAEKVHEKIHRGGVGDEFSEDGEDQRRRRRRRKGGGREEEGRRKEREDSAEVNHKTTQGSV